MLRLAILDDYLDNALRLADWTPVRAFADIVSFRDHLHDPEAIRARLSSFDIVCAMRERTPFPRALLAGLPRLRLLCSTSERNAVIDLDAARDHGITVCGTSPPTGGTAELTWGLIFSLLRHIPQEDAAVRTGHWQVGLGRNLRGLTMGVMGLGTIGAQIARVANAFGMTVIAWSPRLTADRAAALGARLVDKETLFREADIVSLHMVLSDTTRGIVGAADLARMKPTALFLNTSRGPLVDEAALVDALASQRIGGAGLDTFDIEPLPSDHPFRRLRNTVITPHIGYVTESTYRIFFTHTVENVLAFQRGRPIRVMNPAAAADPSQPPWLP